jgi:putative membrane protein
VSETSPPAPAPRPPTRLHPYGIVRGIEVAALLRTVPGVAFVLLTMDTVVVVPLLVVGIVAGGVLRVVAWQRHTIEVTATAVVERRGILNRRERTVELARLQQVEVEQGLVDRMLGTAVVRLETASDASEVELELKVLAVEEARRLRASLAPAAATGSGEAAPTGVELVRVPLHHVAIASLTGRRLLVVPALLGAAFGLLQDLELGDRATDVASDAVTRLGFVAGLLLAAVVVVLTALAALVTGVLRDGDFRIRVVGDDLHVRRGLLATREAVVPRGRLQLVAVHHGWLRRLLGFASLTIHSAGGAGGDVERQLTVPLVPTARARALALALLPDAGPLPDLRPHPPAALRRARVRGIVRCGWVPLVVAGLGLAWSDRAVTVVWLAVAAAVASSLVGWWLGTADHRRRASVLAGEWLAARSGALVVVEVLAPVAKAQGTVVWSSPLQRRRGLATLRVPVAGHGGGVTVLDLDAEVAEAWADDLLVPWTLSAANAAR